MLPKNRPPSHPGEILKRMYLDDLNISQTDLARHIGWKPGKVNEIVNGRRGITPESALSIADALGTSPELWLNLQRNYALWHSQRNHKKIKKMSMAS